MFLTNVQRHSNRTPNIDFMCLIILFDVHGFGQSSPRNLFFPMVLASRLLEEICFSLVLASRLLDKLVFTMALATWWWLHAFKSSCLDAVFTDPSLPTRISRPLRVATLENQNYGDFTNTRSAHMTLFQISCKVWINDWLLMYCFSHLYGITIHPAGREENKSKPRHARKNVDIVWNVGYESSEWSLYMSWRSQYYGTEKSLKNLLILMGGARTHFPNNMHF
jgi:hypothetical protein